MTPDSSHSTRVANRRKSPRVPEDVHLGPRLLPTAALLRRGDPDAALQYYRRSLESDDFVKYFTIGQTWGCKLSKGVALGGQGIECVPFERELLPC